MKIGDYNVNMKIAVPIITSIALYALCFKMISPGYVGVIVDLFGDSKGVEAKELHVGMHWVAPWKNVYEFPIFEQNHTWQGKEWFNFQTSEGMAMGAEIGITFHLRPDSIPIIFQKYRKGMDEITHVFITNFVRDAVNKAASKMTIEDLYGPGKETFFTNVQNHVKADLKEIGIEVSRIYLIGRFHFPDNVIAALNSKIEAVQRAQQRENELREAEAQAKKNVATAEGQAKCALLKAQSEATSNALLSKSVTPELIQWQAIQKWDGKLPQVTGGAMPFVSIEEPKKEKKE